MIRRFWSRPSSSRRQRVRNRRLSLEHLESRALLAVTTMYSHHILSPSADPSGPSGITPAQIRTAYGFDSVSFNGIVGDGRGQTIAIVDAYHNPNVAADLAVFSATFGLPDPPSLRIVNQFGGSTPPPLDPEQGWEIETILDVEWAHAIAPAASILLVEADSATSANLFTAVNYARQQPGVSVVSMSFGAIDGLAGMTATSQMIASQILVTPPGHQGVTFIASSGDNSFASFPASAPGVLGIGGTTLELDSSSAISSEIVWGTADAYEGSGGGISSQFTGRKEPDVAYNADPVTGFSVYNTFGTDPGWIVVGGTSAGAPQWAGLMAIVNQGRVLAGQGTLDGPSQTIPAIYASPSSNFRDIVEGTTAFNAAKIGYDLATGFGSPVANNLIPYLVSYSGSAAPVTSGTITTPPTAPLAFGGTALGATQVSLGWLPAAGATGYTLYQFKNGQPVPIASFNSATTTATVSGLMGGTTYAFNLVAYNGKGTAATPWINVTTDPALNAAQNLHATSSSSTQVSLAWTPSSGATGYYLYQFKNGQPALVGAYGAVASATTVTGLSPGSSYAFNLVAYNAAGSAATPWVTASTTAAPQFTAVQNLQATPMSSTSVQLSWAASVGATGYTIYMWQSGKAVPVLTLGGTATSATISGLAAGSTVHFAIAAYNGKTSANSNWVSATLPSSSSSASSSLGYTLAFRTR